MRMVARTYPVACSGMCQRNFDFQAFSRESQQLREDKINERIQSSTTFLGVTGRTADQSEPAWSEPRRAKEGAPNVLFIVLDDTGFGQFGCYGSPIQTPNLDSLAARHCIYQYAYYCAVFS